MRPDTTLDRLKAELDEIEEIKADLARRAEIGAGSAGQRNDDRQEAALRALGALPELISSLDAMSLGDTVSDDKLFADLSRVAESVLRLIPPKDRISDRPDLHDEPVGDLSSSSPNSKVDDVERDQISDMIAASEARAETKLEKAMGEMRAEFVKINTRLDALPSTFTLVTWIVGTGLGIVAVILTVMALAGDNFSSGRDVGQQLGVLSAKIDAMSVPTSQTTPPPTTAAPAK
jgi:hypothetical protein